VDRRCEEIINYFRRLRRKILINPDVKRIVVGHGALGIKLLGVVDSLVNEFGYKVNFINDSQFKYYFKVWGQHGHRKD